MLPQSHNKNILPQKITCTPALDLIVEPVVQPLRVKTLASEPTSHPRVKPSTSLSLDPHSNAWIKKFPKIRGYSRFSEISKSKRHHGKININNIILRATVVQIYAPKQHITLLPTISSNYRMPSTSTIIRVRKKL